MLQGLDREQFAANKAHHVFVEDELSFFLGQGSVLQLDLLHVQQARAAFLLRNVAGPKQRWVALDQLLLYMLLRLGGGRHAKKVAPGRGFIGILRTSISVLARGIIW